MAISWYEMTNPMVQNDWYEIMVMVQNVHNSFFLAPLAVGQQAYVLVCYLGL